VARLSGKDVGYVDLSIDVGQRLGVTEAELSEEALSDIEEMIEDLAWELGEYIDDVWPRDTGASHADWDVGADDLMWTIRNPREYAEWVHAAGDETKKPIADLIEEESETLISEAMTALRKIVAADRKKQAEEAETPEPAKIQPPQPSAAVSRLGGLFGIRARGFEVTSSRSRERARSRANPRPR
jgi:hypothetical protein